MTVQAQGDEEMLDEKTRFRRAFWTHYAEMYPHTPRAEDFLCDFKGGNPRHHAVKVKDGKLYVKQWLGTRTVGVYVAARDRADIPQAKVRLASYREQFDEVTNGYHPPEAPSMALYASSLFLDTGTRDRNNWNRMVEFLEKYRERYFEVFIRR